LAKVDWYGYPGDWFILSTGSRENGSDMLREYFGHVGDGRVHCTYQVYEVIAGVVPKA
jgi:hypothetical protein